MAPAAGQPGAAGGPTTRYRLRALVSHHGAQCWSGHYTCVARLQGSAQWVSYDDSVVTLLDRDPTTRNTAMRGAYLLLYERDDGSSEAPPLPPHGRASACGSPLAVDSHTDEVALGVEVD